MSLIASCPSTIPPGITWNSTEIHGQNAIHSIFAGVAYEPGGATPTDNTMNGMLNCCTNTVYIGEHDDPYWHSDGVQRRHCGLWCEMARVQDISDASEPSNIWKACINENTDAITMFVNWGEPDYNHTVIPQHDNNTVSPGQPEHPQAMGSGLQTPGMAGIVLMSLVAVAAFLG